MGGEAIIAAAIGLVSGGGGLRLAGRLFGPDRERSLHRYYREVIKGLEHENRKLRNRLARVEDRQGEIEDVIRRIADGDLPPEFS